MKFRIENNRELKWLKNFVNKNDVSLEEEWNKISFRFPFGVIFDGGENKIYKISLKGQEQKFLPISELIKRAQNNKIIIYDNDNVYGPFECNTELEVNDKVQIIDPEQLYTTYSDWFAENNIDTNIAARYKFMDFGEKLKGTSGRIIACGPLRNAPSIKVYCVEVNSNMCKPIYLIDEKGLSLEDTN